MSRVEPHAESGSGVAVGIRTFFITDIRGYTRFSQERGDEAAARLTEAFAQIVGEAVVAHGGEVVELRGDEVLAVFASPRRAILAAVELQSALADEVAADPSVPLLAGVGLDAGEAVPASGGGFRGRALNLAARLCARAAAGEVLASAQVVHLGGAVDGVEFRGVGAFEVKGVAHPVEVVAVVGHDEQPRNALFKPLPVAARPGLAPELDPVAPLVGRDHELKMLRWWWRRARHGRGRSGFVVGDSGMGKTRLVAELARTVHADGWTVRYVRGAGPATESLEELGRASIAQGPTMVIVDDLDMCGGTVLDTVERAVAEVCAGPVLVVGTYRESSPLVDRLLERADPAGVHRVALGPLDAAATRIIADLYLRDGGAPLPSPALLTNTNGVPGLVHRVVGEWVTEQAARRLDSAVSAAAADRPRLRVTTAELASNVVDLESARERVRQYTTEVADAPVVCPFKGLASFEPDDADYFFGRERLVAELTAGVVGGSFLGVVGPSGSGKSSVVKAGLMPALAAGTLPGSEGWQQVVLRPGPHPAAELQRHREMLDATDGRQVVLVVDQFEEVFTACSDEAERATFVGHLTSLAERDDRLVVVAMRADYYGRCAAYPALARLLADNQVLVGSMDAEELHRAILLPARRAGLTIQEGLAEALVADVTGEPGGLPLLSTTLLELWRHRSGRTLTLATYHATSGVHGAVARLAEEAYARLSAPQQTLARGLFLRLSAIGGDGVLVRRRASIAEFDTAQHEDAAQVLEVLTDARLLTRSGEDVEVAHEALLREWPRLRDWLQEDVHGRELHLHLMQAASEWDQHGRDGGELYRGARLSAAIDWAAHHQPELNQVERAFLEQSRGVQHREVRRLRLLLGGALVFLAASIAAGVVALIQRDSAQHSAIVADAQRLAAQALVEPHLDRSLLLAREGVDLADVRSTNRNLFAALLRSPAALRVLHVQGGFTGGPLVLSRDGRTLVVGSGDGLAFYDTRTWKRLARMTPPGFGNGHGGATALADTTDGSLLAVGGGGGTIDLLDGRTHHAVRRPMHVPDAEWIAQLAFSPGGRNLAVGYARPDKTSLCDGAYWVTRFDVRTGRQLRPAVDISGSHPCVNSIDKLIYSRSGDRLIASAWDGGRYGKIVVLGSHDLNVVQTYRVPQVTAVAPSPNGKTLAVGRDDGSVAFMNLTSGRLRSAHDRHVNAQGVWSIAFTPNGRAAVSTSADHTAIVWDVRSGDEREVLTGHTDIVVSQAISEDGQTLYTGSADGTVIAWDLGGRRRLGQELPFSPEYPANIFSLGSATGPQPTSVAVSPNGRLLALSPGHGLVRIWNLETLRPEGPPLRGFTEGDLTYPNGGAQDLAFSPSSRLLAAGGGFGSPIIIWNVATGGIVRTLRPPNPVACRRMALSVRLVNPTCPAGAGLAFSPNGRTLADGDAINGALLWDLKAGTFTRLPVRRGDSVLSLAYSPDGTHLVTIDHQDRGVLWDVPHRHRIASFPAQRANLWGPINVAFSRDGNRFATASGNTIVLRSGSTGKPVAKPISLANAYGGALALSADGSTLAVIAGDGVELWDTSTRTEIGAALPGAPLQNANPGGPGNLLFTPDGHRVIIVNPDGHATIWNFAPSAWKAKACQIAGRNLTEAEWRQFLPDRTYQPVC